MVYLNQRKYFFYAIFSDLNIPIGRRDIHRRQTGEIEPAVRVL